MACVLLRKRAVKKCVGRGANFRPRGRSSLVERCYYTPDVNVLTLSTQTRREKRARACAQCLPALSPKFESRVSANALFKRGERRRMQLEAGARKANVYFILSAHGRGTEATMLSCSPKLFSWQTFRASRYRERCMLQKCKGLLSSVSVQGRLKFSRCERAKHPLTGSCSKLCAALHDSITYKYGRVIK